MIYLKFQQIKYFSSGKSDNGIIVYIFSQTKHQVFQK